MYKSIRYALALLAVLICLPACAETARDITQSCLFNGARGVSLKDDSYRTIWESSPKNGKHAITVEAPQGETIGGVLIRWAVQPLALAAEAMDETGQWQAIPGCEADFLAQYLPVGGASAVRLWERDTDGRTPLQISSATIITPGDVPPGIQQWRMPADKVDLMLIAAHPDDEILWFGGLLPTYAGAQGREVLVVNASYARDDRRLELLDCLWTCSVRSYPVFLGYPDIDTFREERILQYWKWDGMLGDVAGLYRRYRPDVVVLHAADGEYGHAAHKVASLAGREAARAAADAALYPETAEAFGTWDVPKVYLHKHPENPIQLDWHVPLDCFGGRTAFEVADEAFRCHRSQQGDRWFMTVGGENDNSLFGLWHTAVGADAIGNDLFENIQP